MNTWNPKRKIIPSSASNHPAEIIQVFFPFLPRRKYDIGGFCNGILAGTSEPDGGSMENP